MTESRDEFLNRLGKVAWEGHRHQLQATDELVEWERLPPVTQDNVLAIAKPAYEQALFDVMDWLEDQAGGPVPTVFIATGMDFFETIEPWLTERGIDLTEDEDTP